ncbi:MAG: hypothetical protein EBU90_22085 [Proteobacteria bacterium]|jgi:hypothetical protein|nr:hypothetical protein [Pseudomonadota bacterium]NBP15908.1 hypothetical protein [bacterium]
MSVDEYLSLSDKDIQYLLSINAGDYISNPWTGSVITKKGLTPDEELDVEEIEFYEEYFSEEWEDLNEIDPTLFSGYE